ncbi:hypothetical protein DFH27DRAFT_98685 [Peziza echinospora]|nr:hypothetical protein DFH27DRAFT_98685 [Peziza echinospora]
MFWGVFDCHLFCLLGGLRGISAFGNVSPCCAASRRKSHPGYSFLGFMIPVIVPMISKMDFTFPPDRQTWRHAIATRPSLFTAHILPQFLSIDLNSEMQNLPNITLLPGNNSTLTPFFLSIHIVGPWTLNGGLIRPWPWEVNICGDIDGDERKKGLNPKGSN